MIYRITTDHAASSYGVPVILRGGRLVDYSDGIAGICAARGVTSAEMAEALGVSARTVEGWRVGRQPSAKALYDLAAWLENAAD